MVPQPGSQEWGPWGVQLQSAPDPAEGAAPCLSPSGCCFSAAWASAVQSGADGRTWGPCLLSIGQAWGSPDSLEQGLGRGLTPSEGI